MRWKSLSFTTLVAAALASLIMIGGVRMAAAQEQGTSTCLAIARNDAMPAVEHASFRLAQLASDEVRISYVGHSAFRIESPQGISIITDFNGAVGQGGIPTVVTMNHAHSTHYTDFPSPEIQHVLRGWNPDGEGPAKHWLPVGDVLVRNVATDIYREGFLMEANGNSIFIFEIAGLCIGHLGHLHHKLTPEHIAAIGRLDILFMPVDGTYTMSQEGMIELAGQLRSSMVFPMHYFSTFSLQRFLAGMEGSFETVLLPQNEIVVSLRTLPQKPQVVVLPPF